MPSHLSLLPLSEEASLRNIALIGAPSSAGANAGGLEDAPAHLRRCGINFQLAACGAKVTDFGDGPQIVYAPDTCQSARGLSSTTEAARDVLERSRTLLMQQNFILLIGGDCTVTIGLVAAAREAHEQLGLIYMDSQTDLNSPELTDTGILDSMGLAHMIGEARNELSTLGNVFPLLKPEFVVAFGYHPERLTVAECCLLDRLPIKRYPATNILGVAVEAAHAALSYIEKRCSAFIVHFDVDIIDFVAFPVADAPVYRGFGLSFEQALASLAVFSASEKCLGLAVTEFNPCRDRTGQLGQKFVAALAHALIPSHRVSHL